MTELDRGGLNRYRYYYYEGEANTFAGNALVPPILLNEFLSGKEFNNLGVQLRFSISPSAAQNRKLDYKDWMVTESKPPEIILLDRCGYKFHSRFCPICNHKFYNSEAVYCPICGHNRLLHNERQEVMKYSGIELDENSKVKICPTCENELILDGDYCQICGKPIVNKCTNTDSEQIGQDEWRDPCGILLGGDARYCHKCGESSTFLHNKYLKPWEQEQSEMDTTTSEYEFNLSPVHASNVSDFAELDEDDDLPF